MYDLYGILSVDLEEAKASLEAAFDIDFQARESAYQGGEYFIFGKRTEENFVLKRNVDPIDKEPVEMKFPEYPILLYVNDTPRSLDLQKRINQKASKFILLRSQNL
ncbi:hypothetical protein [Herbaspirillum hiltneri]|nr:hypothetical protein [Herbaspirillum hiltneri]